MIHKKIMGTMFLILTTLSLLSCSDDHKIEVKEISLVGKTYVLPLASSQEECNQLQAGGTINCARYLIFEGTSEVLVVLTDIGNNANYTIKGNKLTIELEEIDSDYGVQTLKFTIDDDANRLIYDVNNEDVWKLQIGNLDPWQL